MKQLELEHDQLLLHQHEERTQIVLQSLCKTLGAIIYNR